MIYFEFYSIFQTLIFTSLLIQKIFIINTLKPSSPGFSGSKSYRAIQQGGFIIGVLTGDFMGEGNGET